MNNLNSRLKSLGDSILMSSMTRKSIESQVHSMKNEVLSLKDRVEVLSQVEIALREVTNRVVDRSTTLVDQMVTQGLQYVFDDVKLEFKTIVEHLRGKTSVRIQLFQDGKEFPILESYGGGVIVVVGVLLRIISIIILGGKRILFLDEVLNHVSSQYVPRVSNLLRKMCDDMSFQILLVTHTEEFSESATRHYQAVPKGDSTVFKLL